MGSSPANTRRASPRVRALRGKGYPTFGPPPLDVTWDHALRFQDLAAEYDLARHARRVEGGRRY
jgi:hypothetical protein